MFTGYYDTDYEGKAKAAINVLEEEDFVLVHVEATDEAGHSGNVDEKIAEMGDDAVITLGPLDFDDVIPGWRTVWIKDPEGNIVEITQGFKDQD